MKKETVSKDPLAEEIEEILTPYPDPMSRNDFRIVCHIGTRTSLYLLQSGLVPCKNNGKKTRCYKIAKKDVAEYPLPPRVRPDALHPAKRVVLQLTQTQETCRIVRAQAELYGRGTAAGQGMVRAATGKLPGCTDRCASLRGDRLSTPHNSEMVQQGLAENHLADTQVHDSESMAAGICDIRFFQRNQSKMWKTLCRHQRN